MVLSSTASATELSAFQEGKGVAVPSNQSTFSGITGGAAADKIPAYGSSPPEAQYYQGGQGAPSGPGMAKVQNCASMSPDDDPMKRQECEAVNLLARNPEVRPKFNVSKSDPMILANKHSRENAEPFFQSLGIGGTGSSTECSTRLETTPGQYTTETCSSFREVAEQQCTAGRVIKTDADANFQCDQTVSAYETVKCNKTLNVTVTANNVCSAGHVLGDWWHYLFVGANNPFRYKLTCAQNGYYFTIESWYRLEPPTYQPFLVASVIQNSYIGSSSFSRRIVVEYDLHIAYGYRFDVAVQCANGACQGTVWYLSNLGYGIQEYPFSFSFTQPVAYSYTGAWENGCSTLEARAQ
jgi:hypothetical protein